MISVVIPTFDAEATLGPTLVALVAGALDGLVREVIVVDGGSSDGTHEIADAAGADVLVAPRGRGAQLAAGARKARFPWLLFLHADTVLERGWEMDVRAFIEAASHGDASATEAAAFRFALDDRGIAPRVLEAIVGLRCRFFGLPYGDQGLLISRTLYDEVGGYAPLPLMEDLDMVRRLGRRRLTLLRTRAVTSAVRFRRDGYLRRICRNQVCRMLYFVGVPLPVIVRLYGTSDAVGRPDLLKVQPSEKANPSA